MGAKIKYLIYIGFISFHLTGCQAYVSPSHILKSTQQIPQTFENPLELQGPQPEPVLGTNSNLVPEPSVPDLTSGPAIRPRFPQASRFVQNAEFIMLTEGKKIGTPCNRYLQRVMQYSSYPLGSYLANDFDLYAKKNLSYAKVVHFANDRNGSEVARLKRHLWSYPERTPFIMQWSRPGETGHLAIVERVSEKLIIYQASLNKYTARKDQTTVSTLLTGYNRRTLSVYADF